MESPKYYRIIDNGYTDYSSPGNCYASPEIEVKSGKVTVPFNDRADGINLLKWIKENPKGIFSHKLTYGADRETDKNFYYKEGCSLIEFPLIHGEMFFIDDIVSAYEYGQDIRQLNMLVRRLESTFDVVEPNKNHKSVYGLEYREIILLAATEVENHWVKLLKSNGFNKEKCNTKDYIRLKEFIYFNNTFELQNYNDYDSIHPFINWNESQPTGSLKWYDSYNKIKHNREENINLATLDNAIQSICALINLLMIRHSNKKISEENSVLKTFSSSFKFHYNSKNYRDKNGHFTYIKYFEKFPKPEDVIKPVLI